MYKAILVDDEVLIREAMKDNMDWGRLGFDLVGCFANGKEAITYIRENHVDVVMTDIEMPHMDGLELSRLIYEEFKQIVILILSGYDNFEYARQAMKYKVNEYLLKPFSADELSKVLSRLKDSLDREREENRSLLQIQQTYKKNKVLLKSKLLMDIMSGSRSVEECREELDSYQLDCNRSYFCAALFNFSATREDRQDMDLLSFAVYNIADEILGDYNLGQALQKMDHQVAALISTDRPTETEGRLRRVFEKIQAEVRRCMGLEVTVSIGNFVPKDQINVSYKEAGRLLEYEYLWGIGNIFLWNQISLDLANREKNLSDDEFDGKLRDGKTREIIQHLSDRKSFIKNSYLTKESACIALQNTVDRIKSVLESLELNDSETYNMLDPLSDLIVNSRSLDEAVEEISRVSLAAAEEIRALYENRGEKRAILALDYIRNHYMDPDISLQSVCSYMAMSPSRFSAMFKEGTGSSFVDALTHVRMEKAKELLEHTDLKNYEIAEKVGFKDPHYFSLSFKKATGLTPSEYIKEKKG